MTTPIPVFTGRMIFIPRQPDPVPNAEEAIRRIIDGADIIEAAGRRWLLVEAPEPLLDFLETHGAEVEDLEDDGNGEAWFQPALMSGGGSGSPWSPADELATQCLIPPTEA